MLSTLVLSNEKPPPLCVSIGGGSMSRNGFTIYYKMLFSTAILSKGKALDVKKLDNIKKINLPILTNFLSNFKLIMTLNYDSILENLLRLVSFFFSAYSAV